jgi:pilus assembly protein CpaB
MKLNAIVMLGLAVAFGVLAVFLTNIWIAGQQTSVAAIAPANVIAEDTVVVAAVSLRIGDRLTADNIREIPWPARSLPPGAFKTRQALLNSAEGDRQVITSIEPNEPVLDWKITGPGQRATLSAVLEEGMKAVSIRVNDVLGVAGFVLPGDRVDVLLTRIKQSDGNPYVDVLLQNVKVLAIDQTADDRKEEAKVVKAVTLEVATIDAQRLTLAAGVGQLSLALREAASNDGEITQRITIGDLAAGPPEIETTGAIDPAPVAVTQAPRSLNAQVAVTRGTERTVYSVPFSP